MFRLTVQSSSGPQEVDPDIQKFNAFWDPQRLQNKKYTLSGGSHKAVNVCMSGSTS